MLQGPYEERVFPDTIMAVRLNVPIWDLLMTRAAEDAVNVPQETTDT